LPSSCPPQRTIDIARAGGGARAAIPQSDYVSAPSDVDTFRNMKKKLTVMFLGAMLAGIVAGVGAGGCDEIQNTYNCSDLCNRYQDCFNQSYDTVACTDRCEDLADADQNFDERANDCQNCLNDHSCAGAALSCPSCAGIVP
jgi:hypothetical protein